jgi:hypothetical protein
LLGTLQRFILRSSGNHSVFPGGQKFRAIDAEDYLVKNQRRGSDYDIILNQTAVNYKFICLALCFEPSILVSYRISCIIIYYETLVNDIPMQIYVEARGSVVG